MSFVNLSKWILMVQFSVYWEGSVYWHEESKEKSCTWFMSRLCSFKVCSIFCTTYIMGDDLILFHTAQHYSRYHLLLLNRFPKFKLNFHSQRINNCDWFSIGGRERSCWVIRHIIKHLVPYVCLSIHSHI